MAARIYRSRHLLVLLIVVPKASAATRRFSLAIGTPLAAAARARDDPRPGAHEGQ